MEVMVDTNINAGRPTMVYLDNGEVWALVGKCKMCGKCCERLKCDKLKHEVENGKSIVRCTIYETRPWTCLIWPTDPYEKLPDMCGFVWKQVVR